jgi:hypothetical protein
MKISDAASRWGRQLGLMLVGICLISMAWGQNRVHFGIGLNQSFAKLDSLNYILNSFNAENEWTQEKPLHEIHMPAGITAHIGAEFKRVLVDLQYTMRVAASRSRGPVAPASTESQVMQLRYNASTIDLGLGYFLVRQSRFRMAIGQSLDFGNLKISGRRGVTPQIQGQIYSRYVNELNFASSTFLHFMLPFRDGVSPGIFFRPYYQFSIRLNDYGPLNRAIRPVESLKDPLFLLGGQNNFGLKVGVFIVR